MHMSSDVNLKTGTLAQWMWMLFLAALLAACTGEQQDVSNPPAGEPDAAQTSHNVERSTELSGVRTGEDLEQEGASVESSPKKKRRIIRTVLLSPSPPVHGQDINLNIVTVADLQGDPEYSFEWYLNGDFYPFAQGATLPGDAFLRDDLVKVKISPSLEGEEGRPFESADVVVQNAPPVIISLPTSSALEEGVYVYELAAEDIDGDELTYFLEEAPSDMTISENGRIEWLVPEAFSGEVTFKACVRDSIGAEARQAVVLSAREQKREMNR